MKPFQLGKLLKDRRGSKGIREFARELDVSSATLSRIERGQLPDMVTFSKICRALRLDPAELMDIPKPSKEPAASSPERDPFEIGVPAVHLKADQILDQEAASDLAALILAAQKEIARRGW
jgi:transcriptional regulator with XRE-family HTH domain